MPQISLQKALEIALQHHRAGRLQEAENLYRQILAAEPRHADALHLLGILARQTGRFDIAINLIRGAIALNGNWGEAHNSLAIALQETGALDEAIAAYRQAILVKPNLHEAYNNLGIALKAKGQLDDAMDAYARAITLWPGYADAHYNMGAAMSDKGRLDAAIAAFRQAIALNPKLAEAHLYLGNSLKDRGQLDDAIAAYREAITLRPDYAQAYSNLGNALRSNGRLDDAVAACRRAIALLPDFSTAYNNLGNALEDQGKLEEAIAAYRRAIALDPGYAEAHSNLGGALKGGGLFDEAVAALRTAVALKPDFAQAHNNLGSVLKDKGELDESLASFRRAIALKPAYADAQSNLLLTLQYHFGYDAQAIAAEHRRWNRECAEPLAKSIQPQTNDRNAERRLRIGYVSPDFRNHVVGRNLLPLFSHHDHRQFEVLCYAEVARPDAMTDRFQSLADGWRNTAGLSDEQIAGQIREDRIDLLVDLTLHLASNRLLVFARKPAPVQVTFAGYPASTGLTAIDYRLSDPYLDPPGMDESIYSEKTIRLPDSFWCYDPLEERDIPAGPLPALGSGVVTFGCLNNFCKVNEPVLALWSEVLRQVDDSRLVLLAPMGSHRQRVLAHFEREGIDPLRIEFVTRQDRQEYLETYRRIDIGIDTFPYNGHSTSLDSLWMGVPVVTLVGKTAVGRAGWCQLSNLGLTELAAHDPEQFVRSAVDLANDLSRLGELRSTLRARMQQSPLMDAARFAGNIEVSYRQMWRKWCDNPNRLGTLNAHTGTPTDAENNAAAGRARLDEVVDACRRAVALNPRDAAAHNDLGNALSQRGKTDEAIAAYRQAIALAPGVAALYNNLGNALRNKGLGDQAIAAYEQAIAMDSTMAQAHSNLGNALRDTGHFNEAVRAYQQAIALGPSIPEAHCNLGNALKDRGRLDEALAAYRRAINLRPDYAEAHRRLGIALKDLGRLDESIAASQRALALNPGWVGTHVDIGNALNEKGNLDDAIIAYRRAIALNPNFAAAHSNLGNCLKAKAQLDEAIAAYREAMQIDPANAKFHDNLLYLLHFHADYDAQTIAAEHRRWNSQHALPLASFIRSHSNDRSPTRRLKIGYVSPNFRDHCQLHFMLPLLQAHDPQWVEIFCYADMARSDSATAQLRRYAHSWRNIAGKPDDAVADLIREDQIDVAVDLTMHMAENRLLVFARKPAPVQVSWLAYPGSTGLTAIDYRLSDPYLDPLGMDESIYSEKTSRLPDSFWCYDPLDGRDIPVNFLPALRSGFVTFGCLNNFCKVNDRSLLLWAKVMRQVEHSRLVLLSPIGNHRADALERLGANGIDPSRVEFVVQRSRQKYLETYHRIDIGLDTFPYNGHTTSLDSFWMGVPVVTLVGQTVVSRAGWSELSNLGLQQLAGKSPDEFVRIAAELASDLPRLQEMRSSLRTRMEESPLMDARGFARNIEAAYRQMWQAWYATAVVRNVT